MVICLFGLVLGSLSSARKTQNLQFRVKVRVLVQVDVMLLLCSGVRFDQIALA